MHNPKFLAFADLHIGHKLYNLPELAEDIKDALADIFSIAISHKVGTVVIAGDLYDDNQPKPDIIAYVRSQVRRLTASNIRVVGIAGDHDKPINGETWCQVSDIEPIASIPGFFGYDYYDYSVQANALLERINKAEKKETIEWIFLHGQVPALFKFTDDKKKLDFSDIDVFRLLPNLKGVLLGDIHSPIEGNISDKDKSVYIGYCGTPVVIDAADVSHAKTLFLYDGVKLDRIAAPQRRNYVRINFTGNIPDIFEVAPYVTKYKADERPPVFIVECTTENKAHMHKLKPLYEFGIVRELHKKKLKDGEIEESINIRSELSTQERINSVLKTECKDPILFDLASAMLESADPKSILDAFKMKTLNT